MVAGALRTDAVSLPAALPAREPQVAPRPTSASVSVVLVSTEGSGRLQQSLVAAAPVCDLAGAELVVVITAGTLVPTAVQASFPRVRWVIAPADAGLREQRAAGMQAATGDVVRLVELATALDERTLTSLATPAAGVPALA